MLALRAVLLAWLTHSLALTALQTLRALLHVLKALLQTLKAFLHVLKALLLARLVEIESGR